MKLTPMEVVIVYRAISLKEDGSPRTFPVAQLADAVKIAVEIKEKTTEPGGDMVRQEDHELALTPAQVKLISGCLDRAWPLGDGGAVLSLREKIEEKLAGEQP